MLFDLKVIKSVLDQLQEERGIPKEKVLEAIAMALATAYKKEYGKKGQIVRATFDPETGKTAGGKDTAHRFTGRPHARTSKDLRGKS